MAAGLDALDERERRIVELRFFEEMTQSQIAAEIGISQMHVSRCSGTRSPPCVAGSPRCRAMADRIVRLTFPARAEYLLLARLTLSGLARELPLDDELLADLKLAVTEAWERRAACVSRAAGDVSLVFVIDDTRLQMTVEDYGDGIQAPTRRTTRPTRSTARSRAVWACRSSGRSSTSLPSSRERMGAGRSSGW